MPGPGSTAAWLHLGAFGPKRLDLPADPVSGRLTLKTCHGGHMMYLDGSSLRRLSENIGAFLSSRR